MAHGSGSIPRRIFVVASPDSRKLFPLLWGEGQGEGEFDGQLHRYGLTRRATHPAVLAPLAPRAVPTPITSPLPRRSRSTSDRRSEVLRLIYGSSTVRLPCGCHVYPVKLPAGCLGCCLAKARPSVQKQDGGGELMPEKIGEYPIQRPFSPDATEAVQGRYGGGPRRVAIGVVFRRLPPPSHTVTAR